ncbi:MAG TPA: hypothetical protein VEF76_11270, partial [Patescibacteria group bacterium]|nr:hypothetical protein [Patescibacteria group bacterium]
MNLQDFKKEARKVAVIFAVGAATGGAVGTGLTLHFNDSAAKVETVATARDLTRLNVPSDHRTVVEADVLQAAADGTVVVRAHPWVGQYMITRVQQTGSNAGALFTANITDANGDTVTSPKKGTKVYLRGLSAPGYAGMRVELPNVKPVSDVVAGPIQAKVLRVIDGDTPAVAAEIWPGTYVTISVRVGGIDTPEKKGRAKNEYEAGLAEQASAATRDLIDGKDVLLYNLEY